MIGLLTVALAIAHPEPASLRPGSAFLHDGLSVRAWSTTEGLPQATVSDVAQTPDGFLWVATFGGLARFDGQTFKSYDMAPTDGGATLRISALSAAADGGLWLGLELGGVLYFDGTSYHRHEQPEALANSTVYTIVESDDALWIGGGSGVAVRRDEAWSILTPERFPEGSPRVHDLTVCEDGEVWAASPQGVGRVEGDRLVYSDADGYAIICHNDAVYLGNSQGVFVWNDEVWAPYANVGDVAAFAVSTDGHLWASGYGFISHLEPTSHRWALEGDLTSLHPDREGNLWGGSPRRGLIQMREQPFIREDYTQKYGFGTGPLLLDGTSILFGAPYQTVQRLEETPEDWLPTPLEPLFEATLSMATSEAGPLFGMGDGVYSLDGSRIFETPSGASSLLSQDDDTLWIGTHHDGVYRVVGAEVLHLTSAEGLLSDNVSNIAEAPDGTLWLAHAEGVSAVRDGAIVQTFGAEQGMPPGQVRAMWFDPEERLWIGTYGGGLGLIDGETVQRFTTDNGLFDDVVSVILTDDDGNLWLNGNRGLFRIQYSELEALANGQTDKVTYWPFPTGEGNGINQPAAAILPDGRLVFAMVEGILIFDPDAVSPIPAPAIYIESVFADGVPINSGDSIVAGAREVVASYTSPSLTWPALVRFQTRLLEDSKRKLNNAPPWSAPTTDRQIRFLGLTPGTYTLEVRAINERGERSPIDASITFVQTPFWWQTGLARLLMGVVLISLGALLSAVGWRRARRHASALQEQITQREYSEAERQILSEQLHRSRRLEAIGRLAGGIAHDFNNLLQVVIANTELAQEDLQEDNSEVQESLSEILDASMRGSGVVRQLLAFSRQQVLAPKAYDLNEALTSLAPMVRRFTRGTVRFSVTPSAQPLQVFADRGQIDLAVLNLCINAVDAMPSGGALTLTLYQDKESAVLTVQDTGTGIEETNLPRIFEPFFTTKHMSDGTGLGLSSAQGIVQQSGGELIVESTIDVGTLFTLRLPLVIATTFE